MSLVEWAYAVSEERLADTLPVRWLHVQGVARKAKSFASIVGSDAGLLEAAAVLHDVGYAPDLATTGFHPLDGARFLQSIDAPERLVHLVAHHSCAVIEARLRNLETDLSAYVDEATPVRDALWTCDLTTTPAGEPTRHTDRIEEIKARYGLDSIVGRFIVEAEPQLVSAISRTERRVSAAPRHLPDVGLRSPLDAMDGS
ncbi:HD domain-containing protein [Asanoa sp. NPDC049518]|uniref:HD domain-containing protein n=1 Tax=unclassified Asanoa TaxID=2685164 RepID=UPI00343D6D77